MNIEKSTITITFGDVAENHVGMQKIGDLAECGFAYEDLLKAKNLFEKEGKVCELISLHEYVDVKEENEKSEAYILIVRKAIENADDVFNEQSTLDVDKKAFMYGRVVNKHARYNLCFGEKSQEPDYEEGKGRVIAFDDVPLTKEIKMMLPKYFGEKADNLMAEGNYYYDVNKCGIGFHGDSERKKVIAIRLGAKLALAYQWYYKNEEVGVRCELELFHGDLYVMSEKATGFDWKRKNILTLRHAAGCSKFMKK